MTSFLLSAKDIGHSYPAGGGGRTEVFSGLDLSLGKSEFVVVRGASGSGKTTLLSILGTMLRPSSGDVEINGQNPFALSPAGRAKLRAQSIGFVFQTMHLLPFLTVVQNATLAAPKSSPQQNADAIEMLNRFGLGHRLDHKPGQLSVGERQRVAMVRALMPKPSLLLADEPTGNLDADNSRRIVEGLQEFQQQGGCVVVATHSELPDLQPTQQLSLAT